MRISKGIEPKIKSLGLITNDIYGGGPMRISQILNIPLETAKEVYLKLKKTLPVLDRFLNNNAKFAVRNFYINGSKRTNRRRWFSDLYTGKMEPHSVERQAKNFPIQSANACMIKEAINEIMDYFDSIDNIAEVLFTVHDEVDFIIPENREDIGLRVKEIMEEVGGRYLTNVKMDSDLTIGHFWKK